MKLPGLVLLQQRAEFLAVAATRLYCSTPGLVLQVRRQAAPEHAARIAIGFTATRKVGGAVVRNRAKRRLRALAAEMLPLCAVPAHDYVLVARVDTTVSRPFADLRRDLETALKKLRCWRMDQAAAIAATAP